MAEVGEILHADLAAVCLLVVIAPALARVSHVHSLEQLLNHELVDR